MLFRSVVSAHRTPDRLFRYAREAAGRGLRVVIAGAGGAAHLPGMTASLTELPVIGVPVRTEALGGVDSLYSIVQMPPGVPVATVAINGARNAGLLAVQILGVADPALRRKMSEFKAGLRKLVEKKAAETEREYPGPRTKSSAGHGLQATDYRKPRPSARLKPGA